MTAQLTAAVNKIAVSSAHQVTFMDGGFAMGEMTLAQEGGRGWY